MKFYRRRAQLARDISVLRRVVELKRCADLFNAPVFHNAKTVGDDRHRLFLVMRYMNEGVFELALLAIESTRISPRSLASRAEIGSSIK